MDIVKTVKQKLLNNTRYFGLPLGIYREVLEAVSLAVKAEWSAISGVEHSKSQKSYVENLIHATRSNLSPKYSEFDQRFHKFPSYLRRAAIAEAGLATETSRTSRKLGIRKKTPRSGDRNRDIQVVKNSQIDNLSVRAHPAETTKCKTSSDKKMGCCLTEESVFC
jgi:hypothetical protein